MGKKARNTELVAIRTLREQEWTYEAWRQRLGYKEMRRHSALSPADGGLGYELSEGQLKARLDGYRERLKLVLEAHVDEHRERQVAELNELSRLAQATLGKAARDGKLDRDAARLLLDIHAREAKLLGLDAPQQIRTEVVTNDSVTEELNTMLARAGLKPVEMKND
jgi:hypothetical protein